MVRWFIHHRLLLALLVAGWSGQLLRGK